MDEGLPRGIVTFLMTDIVGSTRLWETEPGTMSAAMARHDDLLEAAVGARRGHVLKERGEGDSRFAVFTSGSDAVAAAVAVQQGMAAERWETSIPIELRAGIHTGFANPVSGDYYGSAVNRCARIRSLGHGGQTLMSMSTHELIKDDPLPDHVSLRDMGEHFLKDLTRPERLFQVDIAGLPQDFPALSSIASTPNNLPGQLTELIGRRHELSQVQGLLEACPLVTILAPGGAGKTRLAIQAAAQVLGEFPQGVFLVELASTGSPSQLPQAIAEALDVPLSSEGDLLEQLLRYLANKRVLLVLDNFEHLVDGAFLVGAILHAAPLVTVVVTSRIKLGLSSETIFTLPGLDVTWTTADDALETDGVRLFTQAAQRANPSFVLARSDLASLQRILEVVQGMPLGILLAAGWADMLSVDEIAAEIGKSADFLETKMGDVPDRHRSIRAVFEYSWAMLGPEERETFSALSVFRGGFTRAAAEQVAGASLRGLSSLVDKSLVAADSVKGRFSIHELLRQYGAARLESDPDRHRHVAARHASFYADVMDLASSLIRQSDQPLALGLMEADLDNIRTAWRHYAAIDDRVTPARFVEGLWFLHEVRGWYPAGLGLFEEAAGTPAARAAQAWFHSLLSRPDIGVERAAEAIVELRRASDPYALMFALGCQSLSSMYAGDLEGLRAASDEMAALGARHEDPWWASVGMCWSMYPRLFDGRVAEARSLARSALDESVRLGDHMCRTFALYGLAQIAMAEGKPADALDHLQQSGSISREIGFRRGSQWALKGMGQAAEAGGDLVSADGHYLESLETSYDLAQAREMLAVMLGLVRVRIAMGSSLAAAELLGTILADPAGSQVTPPDPLTIHESAARIRSRLAEHLEEEALADASHRGSSRTTEMAARELLTTSQVSPRGASG